jgi:integrase
LRLCQGLDLAVKHSHIPRNYARDCEMPRSKPRVGIALTKEQVHAFLAHATRDHYHPLWHLALATGLRRAELLGLRWKDVDLTKRVLLIRHTNVWLGKPRLEERTKTPASVRAVKIDATTAGLLASHKAAQSKRRELAGESWQENDLVICTRHGKPIGAPNMHRNYKDLLDKAGLPANVTIHHMRHTHLSALIDAGVPIATVAERGGYRNPATLLAVYTHAYAASHDAAAAVAEQLISTSAYTNSDAAFADPHVPPSESVASLTQA